MAAKAEIGGTALPHGHAPSMIEPLKLPLFRRIWSASVFSNLGIMIQAVGAAWEMMQLTGSPKMVALVQAALMLPIMLVAIPAGAIADMFDRRKVAIAAICLSLTSATGFTLLQIAGLMTPWLILLYCFVVGTGMALLGPAWQSSVAEQVPPSVLPQAVALNSVSYNSARSVGPAVGGLIVAASGAVAAFIVNALLYLPLLIVMLAWRRTVTPSRLPPERIGRAITSGLRYVAHAPAIRTVVVRTFVTSGAGGALASLLPIVARDLLHGHAPTFGAMLGCFGGGAVLGAFSIHRIIRTYSSEGTVGAATALVCIAAAMIAFSSSPLVSGLALIVAGAAWMGMLTSYNIAIQTASPRWIAGRMLATFQASSCGGIAASCWVWGSVAQGQGIAMALLGITAALAATILLGRVLPMPAIDAGNRDIKALADPDIALAISGRSGPVLLEVQYRVAAADARAFYRAMFELQHVRQRNGAVDWSLARDLSDERIWIERYECPTWHDYLRQRSRMTRADLAVLGDALAFHAGDGPPTIRRMLERPFGSVRWRDDSPDPASNSGSLPIGAMTQPTIIGTEGVGP